MFIPKLLLYTFSSRIYIIHLCDLCDLSIFSHSCCPSISFLCFMSLCLLFNFPVFQPCWPYRLRFRYHTLLESVCEQPDCFNEQLLSDSAFASHFTTNLPPFFLIFCLTYWLLRNIQYDNTATSRQHNVSYWHIYFFFLHKTLPLQCSKLYKKPNIVAVI